MESDAYQPLVSVVIVAYRHRDYVAQAIDSAAGQDYPNLDIVVVDDGSPDDTFEVARIHVEASGLRNTRLFRKENGGVSSAFNFGIAQARGELIALLAADDYYAPGAISRWVENFARLRGTRVALVHANTHVIYENGRIASMDGQFNPAVGSCFFEMLTREKGICGSSIMFTRKAFDATGGYDENLHGEDFDFYARLAALGYEFHYDRFHTTYKRMLSSGLGADILKWKDAPFATLEKHRAEISPQSYRKARTRIYLYLMRLASQNGKYAIARDFTRELCLETGSPHWYAVLAWMIVRHRIVGILPGGVRETLRSLRRIVRQGLAAR